MTEPTARPSVARLWVLIALTHLAPFLVFGIAGSILAAARGAPMQQAGELVTPYATLLTVGMHAVLLGLLTRFLRRDGLSWTAIGWRTSPSRPALVDAGLGLAVGLGFALLDQLALFPLVDRLPASGMKFEPHLPTFGLAAFAAINLIGALSEEAIYRGYALTHFGERHGTLVAVVLSVLTFGPLHWANGVWVMLWHFLFGLFLAGVFLWRRSLIAVYLAHLVVNFLPRIWFELAG